MCYLGAAVITAIIIYLLRGWASQHIILAILAAAAIFGALAFILEFFIFSHIKEKFAEKEAENRTKQKEQQRKINMKLGSDYEKGVAKKISSFFNTVSHPNLILPIPGSRGNINTTEADIVFVIPKGILCVECKYSKHQMRGSLYSDNWEKEESGYQIENPIKQNTFHISVLRDILLERFGTAYEAVPIFNIICTNTIVTIGSVGTFNPILDLSYFPDVDAAIMNTFGNSWQKPTRKHFDALPDCLTAGQIAELNSFLSGLEGTEEQRREHAERVAREYGEEPIIEL